MKISLYPPGQDLNDSLDSIQMQAKLKNLLDLKLRAEHKNKVLQLPYTTCVRGKISGNREVFKPEVLLDRIYLKVH